MCVKIFIERRNVANTNRFISLDRLIRDVKGNNTGPLGYFSFQPVPHDKRRGMCYPVFGMMHIKEPLLLIGKSDLCGGGGLPQSLFQWFFTIYLTPYNRK